MENHQWFYEIASNWYDLSYRFFSCAYDARRQLGTIIEPYIIIVDRVKTYEDIIVGTKCQWVYEVAGLYYLSQVKYKSKRDAEKYVPGKVVEPYTPSVVTSYKW